MLDTVSYHHESIDTPIRNLGRHHRDSPALNVQLLKQLARESATKTGTKRSAQAGWHEGSSKRTRTSNGHSAVLHGPYYPDLPLPKSFALHTPEDVAVQSSGRVPVLTHTLDIHFDGKIDPAFLQELQDTNDSTFNLGAVHLVEYESRMVATHNQQWLMVIPQVIDDVDVDDEDYTAAPACVDLIFACDVLRRAHKVKVHPEVSLFLDGKSFHLQVRLVVSLSLPKIFYPLSRREPKKNIELVEAAQRRVLGTVFGTRPEADSTHDVNISFFYSVLQAARPMASGIADDSMQPELLNPTLLPFQRRSVGWLLGREGLDVTPQGEIVPSTSLIEHSFWTPVTLGNHSSWFHRLSGELSPEEPSTPPPALGGILAEEPGLGKTLEMISLILLNPPDETRNPSVTRWDPEARLDVKAVKTSLIVTPPALASQWVDEIKAHAPSLKVLVYDGWSKVEVPITRSQLEADRLKTLELEKKLRQKSKAKGKGKGKAIESKSKAKSKAKPKPVEKDEGPDMTRDSDGNLLEWCDYVQQFDIVVTTYQVLRSDFNVARAPPVRPRREDVVYQNVERPRSPLVMVEWNRVIMDEVQMVGGANLEDMVSLIPRLSSFAVSGTPARAQISDLIHALKFLRVFEHTIGSAKLWRRLIKPGFAPEFSRIFQNYAIRTTKASVKQELTIPQQTRYLVPIELGRIERHVYDQALEAVLLELGLDARGVAASEGWEVDGSLLRSSIRRLRGICTHPQVGQLQKKGDTYKRGALKSMDAVLENMRDQNWKNVMEDWKAKIQLIIRYAQLIQQDDGMARRRERALEALELAEKEINNHIKEINAALEEHHERGEILKQEAAARRRAQQEAATEAQQGPEASTANKGKDKAVDQDPLNGDDHDEEEEEEEEENVEDKGLPKTPAGKEHRVKTQGLKARLREGKLILHRVRFLMGDVFHLLERSGQEDAAYESAENLRRELLKVSEDDATRAMAQLDEDLTKKRFNADDLDIELPYLGQGGIRSAELMEEANEIIEEVLNEQTKLLLEWRAHIVDLLTQPLNGKFEDAEGDGQEYQRNLDNQGEAEVYMQAYAALIADRRQALINERTLLAAHDVREKKLRHTKAAMKAAAQLMDLGAAPMEIANDVELLPEHEVMYKGLSDKRKELLNLMEGRAIKSILVDLNAILQRMSDRDKEKELVAPAIADIRRLMTSQNQLHDKLDADLVLIRKAFNERILYFRQLQEISDSVAEVEWDHPSLADAIEDCLHERVELDGKINTNRARHRYLVNLVNVNAKGASADSQDDEESVCILCRCDFIRGFITQCAHIYCEGCMKAWLARREGKTCPVCRVAINPDTVQRFTVNPTEAEAPQQPVEGYAAPQSTRKISYNFIDPGAFDEILKVESLGDFGSKIQTLVQHLLYLQTEDPGAKSIVFSAWADSLHIVEWALHMNGIRSLRIDQNSRGESAAKKFRTDPDILVLLLHGERENAGLNVTCASRVFLLESVVHHSFEVQAIARIDRMGQTRPTEVYCYYAEDTVERNILNLAARKGLSLYTKDKAAGTLDVSSFSQEDEQKAIDSPIKKKLQKGDFIFKVDDMLAILFPHMFEEIEYLVPQEDDDVEMAEVDAPITTPTRSNGRSRQNAVAGPSRLAQ